MAAKKVVIEKELSNNEFNDGIFFEIKVLQDEIAELKLKLKPIVAVKNATLAECNAMNRKK